MYYRKLYLTIATFILLSGCSGIFTSNHKIELDCREESVENLIPPKGTYKCHIELLAGCSQQGAIQILSDGKIQKGKNFSTQTIGTLMNSDWYSGELGIVYMPSVNEKTTEGAGSVILKVVFYTN